MLDWINNSKGDGGSSVNFPGFKPELPQNKPEEDQEMKKTKKNFLVSTVLSLIILGSVIIILASLQAKGIIKISKPSSPAVQNIPEVNAPKKIQSSCLILEEQYCSGFKLVKDLKDPNKVIGVGESLPVGAKIAAPFDGYGIIMKGTDPEDKNNFYPMVAFISGDAPVPPTPKDNIRAFWIGNVNLNKASYLKFSKGEVIGEITSDKIIIKESGLNSYFLSSINTVKNNPELQLIPAAADYLKALIKISAQ